MLEGALHALTALRYVLHALDRAVPHAPRADLTDMLNADHAALTDVRTWTLVDCA